MHTNAHVGECSWWHMLTVVRVGHSFFLITNKIVHLAEKITKRTNHSFFKNNPFFHSFCKERQERFDLSFLFKRNKRKNHSCRSFQIEQRKERVILFEKCMVKWNIPFLEKQQKTFFFRVNINHFCRKNSTNEQIVLLLFW